MTNLSSLSDLFRAAMKLAAACAFATAIATGASAQTNTFPENGNAGIGTTTPAYPLTINQTGNSVNRIISLANDSSGSSAQSAISFFEGATEKFKFGMNGSGATGYVGGANAFQLWHFQNAPMVFGTNASERMRINGDGNIGIGTTTPTQKLNVIGNGLFGNLTSRTLLYSTYDSQQNPFLEVGNGTSHSATTPFPFFVLSNHTTSTSNAEGIIGQIVFANRSIADNNDKRTAVIASWVDGASNSGTLQFYTSSAGAVAERLRITSAGNVGIGTTTPQTKFDIKQSSDTFVGGLHLRRSTTNDTWALVTGADNSLYMGYANNASGADAMSDFTVYPLVLTGSGKVGIGTATPAYKLDVQGGQINSSGGLCIADDCKTAWSQVGGGGGTITGVTAGSGLTGGGTTGSVTLNVGAGTGITVAADTVSVNYGSTGGTAVEGNKQVTIATDGSSGLSGGSTVTLGSGGNFTLANTDKGSSQHIFKNVANSAGTTQFSAGTNNDAIRFAGSGGTSVTFDGATKKITIDGSTSTIQAANVTAGQFGAGNYTISGNLTVSGTVEGGNIKAKYQDLAEWVPSSEQLAAGTVVVLDTTKSNQVISSGTAYDTRVAGVISAQPGITLGEAGEGKVLVATTGRVRVKVDATRGAIQIGDLLVTSDVSGVAMKSEPVEFAGRKMHMPGTIIGKALEPLAKGKGEILVLLSLQ